MYHEERVIDGKLCWRSSPEGEFQEFSQRELTLRLINARESLKEMVRDHRDNIRDAVAESGWKERQGEEYGSY